jgi:hypothetical protein
VKGKGTYVTRQLAENVKMREKIAMLEQKQVQFHPLPDNFPPLHAPHRTPSYQPQQVHSSLPAPPPFIPLVLARTPKGPRATGASTGHKRTDRCTAPAPGGAAGISAPLNILTWNAANLARGTKELALSHLLVSNNVDVAVITETELPAPLAVVFSIGGYTTYLPLVLPGVKTHVLTLVKSNLAVQASVRLRLDLMS